MESQPINVMRCLFVFAVIAAAHAAETPVAITAEGSAPGLGPAARSAAILDAQTSVILDRLESLAPSRDFSVFTTIIENAQLYFQSFKLLKESKDEEATHVEIETHLFERQLKQDVAATVMDQSFIPPRIILIAAEQLTGADETVEHHVIETKLREELTKVRFDVVPDDVVQEKVSTAQLATFAGGDPEASARIARNMLVELVVLGSATTTAERDPASANLHRVTADVTLRVVRAADGYVIDAPTTKAVVHSVNPAEGSVQAIEDACEKLFGEVKTAIALGALGGTPQDALLLTIEGVTSDKQVDELCAAVKGALEIEKVEPVYREESLVRLRASFDGPVGAFVDILPMMPLTFGQLKVTTAVDRDLTLRIVQQ